MKALFLSVAASFAFLATVASFPAQGSPEDTIDVVHYDIHIEHIDFSAQSLDAYAILELTTPYEGVASIPLEIISLTVDSVFLEGSVPLSFIQYDTLLRIGIPEPFGSADTVAVSIYYHGVPFHESWGGFHFYGSYAFNLGVGLNEIPHNLGKTWFPCIDNFTDRALYDFHVTVDDDKEAICGGLLDSITMNGDGTRTFHWTHSSTLPTYLVSMAAGDYVLVSDTFHGVEREVPIDIYVRPQDSSKVTGTFVNLKDILGIYESLMGPYPFERIGYTGTELGAMEHAANIFVPHFTISGGTGNESLMAHELSHMWVGDMVTCSSAEEMWLNEGWATFFAMYYALLLYGDEEEFRDAMRETHAGVLQYCHTPTPPGDGSYFPLNDIPQTKTYGMSAYDKGATVTQALRFYLGDSLFFESLAAYLQSFAFSDASSYDMRDFLTAHTGIGMGGFFDNWVFHAGTPHYSLDSFYVIPAGDLYEVHLFPRQKRKGPAFGGTAGIMEVRFLSQGWQQFTDTLHFSGETGHSVKLLPFEPVVILVDPDERMCDATTDETKTIYATGNVSFDKTFFQLVVEEIADSAFIQVTHHWAPPDSLENPPPELRISDYRYWRIDGLVPQAFQATGRFLYMVNGFLDNTLITGEQDSVVILYRRDASEPWQSIPFEKIGNWNVGNIFVYDLQMGDYALAVWDTQVNIPERPGSPDGRLKIYPNPSDGSFSFKFLLDDPGVLVIYGPHGQQAAAFAAGPGHQELRWSPAEMPPGQYLASLRSKRGEQLDAKKFIFSPR
jgi:aminopeptidase N